MSPVKNEVTVVVLAAGLGTRMKSAKAKVLHQAGGDTLLNHVLRAALAVAVPENIVVVVGYQAEEVKASVTTPGVRFAVQQEQKGTGHALLCARDVIENRQGLVLILNGDGPLLRPKTVSDLVQAQKSRSESSFIITTLVDNPFGYGRILRDESGHVGAIVEQKSATPEQLQIREINTGQYLFDAKPFWPGLDEIRPDNPAREYYLTDMVEILNKNGCRISPFLIEDETELLGINTRVELAVADSILRSRKNHELMLSGVTIENPGSVLIDTHVSVEPDTLISANVQLRGTTRIGANCTVGAGSILKDCVVEDGVQIHPYVVAQDTHFGAGASVGPFARLRKQSEVGENVHIGNFVELKNTRMGRGAKANHLAYLGDASIGSGSNIGAGAITCNYDGANKYPTTIEANVFVGSNSTLVAPVRLGSGSYVAAASVITEDVEPDALALGRARQVNKPEWAKKRRQLVAEQKKSPEKG